MAKVRKLLGQPLLMASAGLSLAGGCHSPKPVGNLMYPPHVEAQLCVDKTPESAMVFVDGSAVSERCTTVEGYDGRPISLEISAPGYAAVSQQLTLKAEMPALTFTLQPADPEGLAPRPVGNLMPPPQLPPKP